MAAYIFKGCTYSLLSYFHWQHHKIVNIIINRKKESWNPGLKKNLENMNFHLVFLFFFNIYVYIILFSWLKGNVNQSDYLLQWE